MPTPHSTDRYSDRAVAAMQHDIIRSLQHHQKWLPSKYLYDQRGCDLFDQICELEEYYPTRTELAIMRRSLPGIADVIGSSINLLELGSGSSVKTELLLEACQVDTYAPFDIATEHLRETTTKLRGRFPDLEIVPINGDFGESITLPARLTDSGARTIVYFPGSTMGNFGPSPAGRLMERIAGACNANGGLLIGLDLQKDQQTLIRAYDDAQGVTAEFNFNLLRRLNRELNADFDLGQFRYEVEYNGTEHRIEAYLVSRIAQRVSIGDTVISFAAEERICTEWSYKYQLDDFARWATQFGFAARDHWTDVREYFAVIFLEHNPNLA